MERETERETEREMENPDTKKQKTRESGRSSSNPELNSAQHVNTQLKGKLKILTAEMQDAVERMNSMTQMMNTIREDNVFLNGRLSEVQQENAALLSRIEGMVNERAERDAAIDEFGAALEARIVQWKNILDDKDVTIAKLKENLLYGSSDGVAGTWQDGRSRTKIERLIQDIDRRDEIINDLQSKLAEAVLEINESSALIEKFKSEYGKGKTTGGATLASRQGGRDHNRAIDKRLEDSSRRIKSLEDLLERAEEDAKTKSEQLCDALGTLNKYENEKPSLAEALGQIRELKAQVRKKGLHIEDLLGIVNKLELENSRFEEAIVVLREKMGVAGREEEFSMKELILRRQESARERDKELQREKNRLSSENVDLKYQMRKLRAALRGSEAKSNGPREPAWSEAVGDSEPSEGAEDSRREKFDRMKENVEWMIEENEALRQGMHEILDCIHKQDGKSMVRIQSETLEKLLEALDARHLAGWYHPAMRLQGRVNYLQGSNAELRAQLQQIRKNQMVFQGDGQMTAGSIEEGECVQQRHSSRNLTPDDSGRASGKAVEMDDIQQTEVSENTKPSESGSELPMDDEEFGKAEEIYAMAKEIIAQEGDFKRALTDSEKQRKLLEHEILTLKKSLASSVSPGTYNELREKYLEANMRLRADFEEKLIAEELENGVGASQGANAVVVRELRGELISVHKLLSELTAESATGEKNGKAERKEMEKLEGRVAELTAENETLRKSEEIAREECLVHRAIDSTVLAEFNELRERMLKLDDEETDKEQESKRTARLSLELANYKVTEIGLREQKKLLENELLRLREELTGYREHRGETVPVPSQLLPNESGSRDYVEIIDFLQHQYAGSTSLSAWERYEASSRKLRKDREEAKCLIVKINDQNESVKIHQETLTNRLQIVEQLKDMLEQQIGSTDVQDIMHKFTNKTKQVLSESQCKVRIGQLEEELRQANARVSDYEAKLEKMEEEVCRAQKSWRVQRTLSARRPLTADKLIEATMTEAVRRPTEAKYTQTQVRLHSVETQCSPGSKGDVDESEKETDESEIESMIRESGSEAALRGKLALLQEQLGQALSLASERSTALSKCESQLAEYVSKNAALVKLLDERISAEEVEATELPEPEEARCHGSTSQEALQSTINSLRKIIERKEATIARYQSLLKEDREKHNEATSGLQEEIRGLKKQLAAAGTTSRDLDNALFGAVEHPEKDPATRPEAKPEESSALRERLARLEAELSVSGEVADRWHRLAEERLRHMDTARERLEEQHNEEVESYRMELKKRQCQVEELRRQLAESRRPLTTRSQVLSFMKTLKIKDNRLADEIENELEEHIAVTQRQQQQQQQQQFSTDHDIEEEVAQGPESEPSQAQLENLRKHIQMLLDREKSYKSNIADLQQQLSRKYMAVKSQEKKASRREVQLERKVKELERELNETRELMDRHFLLQQAKRVKTAEDLGLWEKLKKWQQTAERLKERLKEKTDECQRLQSNYEKLRNLISCIEREKWYLRGGRYRGDGVAMGSWMTSGEVPPRSQEGLLVESLQRECQELRERVKELVDRLNHQDSDKTDNHTSSPSVGDEMEDYPNNEVQKSGVELEDMLEKDNLRLEAENFELRLELERTNLNLPRYVELLNTEKPMEPCCGPGPSRREGTQHTRTELERTIVALKNLVEKLQSENKALRTMTLSQEEVESNCCDCRYLRAEWERAGRRVAFLETELELAQKRIKLMEKAALDKCEEDGIEEAAALRIQLNRKADLLLKVKDLLTKAALNEKVLRQRIQQLEYKQTLSIIPECGTSLA